MIFQTSKHRLQEDVLSQLRSSPSSGWEIHILRLQMVTSFFLFLRLILWIPLATLLKGTKIIPLFNWLMIFLFPWYYGLVLSGGWRTPEAGSIFEDPDSIFGSRMPLCDLEPWWKTLWHVMMGVVFFFGLVFLGNDKKGNYQITSEFPKTWGRLVYWNEIVCKGMGYLGCRSLFGTLLELLIYFVVYVLGRICVHRKFPPDEWIGSFPVYVPRMPQSDMCFVRQQLNQHLYIWPDNSNQLWESAVQTILEAYFLSLVLSLEDFDHDCLYLNEALARAIFQSLVV